MGPLEIILIIVVIALVFGASKLPQLGKGLGQGIKEFKTETREANRPGPDAVPLNPELRGGVGEVVDVQATELKAEPVSVAEQRDRQA